MCLMPNIMHVPIGFQLQYLEVEVLALHLIFFHYHFFFNQQKITPDYENFHCLAFVLKIWWKQLIVRCVCHHLLVLSHIKGVHD